MCKVAEIPDADDRTKPFAAGHAESKNSKRGVNDIIAMKDTPFGDSRYGICQTCGGPIVIPGLAQCLCARCGWVKRRGDTETIGPRSHHE